MTARPGNEGSRCENVESRSTEKKRRRFLARLARPVLLMMFAASALLTALPAAAQCNPFTTDCEGTPTTGPDVGMSPDGGSWTVDSGTAVVPISIYITDADGLNASTLNARLWSGQTNVLLNVSWTVSADERRGTLKGDLELKNAGDNIVVVEISDKLGNPGRASATFRLNFTEPGLPIVSLDPHHSEYRNTAQGAFVFGYDGPSYTSMDAVRSVGLVYNSEQARPTGFVQVDAKPDPANAAAVVAMSLRIERWSSGSTGTQPLVAPESFYAKAPDGGFQRLAVHWVMGENVPTGAYKYWAVVRAYRSPTAWSERRTLVRVLVINQKTSIFGAGWSLAGNQRLHSTADGLLLDEGSGIARFFKGGSSNGMCTTGACTYETPAGDFTVLTYRADTGKFVRTYPDGSQVIFADSGYMSSTRDRFGNATTYDWQNCCGVWLLTKVEDPVGQKITFAYLNGWVTTITAAGRTMTVAHDGAHQLTSVSGPPNLRLTYNPSRLVVAYTTNFSHGSYVDPDTTSDLTYDEFRQVASIKAATVTAGGSKQRPTISFKSLPSRTAPSPNATYSVTNPAPALPSNAVAIEIIDPLKHTTKVAVDRYGNPTKVVDPAGLTTTTQWTADGLPSMVSTPTSSSAYVWNHKGLLLVQTVGTSVVHEASYNAQNLPEFVASGGTALWYAYDSNQRLVRSWPGKKEDEQRTATTYTYNSRHQLIRSVGPKGEKTESSYENNAWRNTDYATITREDGIVLTTSYTYDTRSRTVTVRNPLNQTVTIEYDDFNRPVKVIDAKGGSTVREYTGAHLTKVTDPGAKVFTFTYNALGWLESEQFPGDGTSRKYTYDLDGLVTGVKNRLMNDVTFTYDEGHRLLARSADGQKTEFHYPDAYTTVVKNSESEVTIGLIHGVGTLGFVSSTLNGRIYQVERVVDTNNGWRDIGFNLNTFNQNYAMLRTERVRYHTDFSPSNASLSGTYQIEDMSGYRTTRSFDTSGRPVQTAFPGGLAQNNLFTSDGRLVSTTFSSSSVNQKLGAKFDYDSLGRLSTRTSVLDDLQWQYEYDAIGQLVRYGKYRKGVLGNCDPAWQDCTPIWLPMLQEDYTYDASGNRTDRGGATTSGSNRYTAFNDFTYEYDAEGNLKRKSSTKSAFVQTYDWNTLGQLTAVTTNGSTVTYGYDGLGRRVRRTEGGQSRYYVHDGDNLLLDLDQSNNVVHMYTHWPGVDNPHSVRVTSGGQNFTYYYTTEHPGHVTGLVSIYGAVGGEHRYKPFGEVESSSEEAGQPLRFMGRELDFTTGLYFVRNRWYDPTIARFVSQDPIGMRGGLNTYAYVGNDPINWRDPSGLNPCKKGGSGPRDVCLKYMLGFISGTVKQQNDPGTRRDIPPAETWPEDDDGYGPELPADGSCFACRDVRSRNWQDIRAAQEAGPPKPRQRTVKLDCTANGYARRAGFGAAVGGALGAGAGWLKGGGALIIAGGVFGLVVAGPGGAIAMIELGNASPLGVAAARGAVSGGLQGVATGSAGAVATHANYCGDLL
jgi:RHS repeat-associated protein